MEKVALTRTVETRLAKTWALRGAKEGLTLGDRQIVAGI